MSADPRPSNVETMSEPLSPSALVEALEKWAADKRAHAKYVSENRDDWFCTAPGDYEDRELREAKTLEDAAAFIRSTMEAVEHVLQSIDWEETSTHMAPSIDEKRAFDIYHRLRTLTGAHDER